MIKIEEKVFQRRSHSYIQHPFSHQRDRKDSTKSPENKRLSAVVSKYFKPIAKQTWQMDSSSWEFLNQINQNQSENATTTTACMWASPLATSVRAPAARAHVHAFVRITSMML